jgi:putative heme-binding domain-containing protein
MTSRPRFVLGVLVLAIAPALSAQPSPTAAPAATPYAPKQADRPTPVEGDEPGFLPIFEGDRVILLGDAFVEGEQYQGWIEVMLTSRFPDRNVTFRNLGWSGDTPVGDSRFGLSLLQAGREPTDEGWKQLVKQLTEARPTVAFIGYGMASSFDGAAGLAKFRADYAKLLETLESVAPGVRLVLVGPIRHENLGAPWRDPSTRNQEIALYSNAVRDIAAARGVPFLSLFDRLQDPLPGAAPLTQNGIRLNAEGYRAVAQIFEDQLFGSAGAWRENPRAEDLRQSILRKNEWFFHRSRPANMAYIFGFRNREQGRNAAEVIQFDTYIAQEEQRIAQLRGLQAVNVPEIPRRIGNISAPLTPQAHPSFVVADDLEVTLWAENPMLDKPIQMNWDTQGRLLVSTSAVYPQIEPGQAPTDKIVILEDTDADGKADKSTVFADGLLIPTGVEWGDGGAYVTQSTDLLHFRDTDGDGKADVREAIMSGFGTEDTHHNLHSPRFGPDGRLYLMQSVYTRTDAETPFGVVRLKAGGIFRFDPRDQRMEILFRGWVNAWGHQFDAYGQSFVTDGAGSRGINWGVPGATYFTLAPAARTLQSVSPGDHPKFSGIEVIRSAHFPADWQGTVVTNDFRAHRVVRFKLTDQGAGYVTQAMPDLIRTTDPTFRPVDIKLGPDGALYVADWSNPIIQHGEVDFRDPRRDKAHGRIWRISAKGRAPLPKVNFTTLSTGALLDLLLSPNTYDQERARRVLVERGSPAVLAELNAWTDRNASDEARLQAMWMYQGFNQPRTSVFDQLFASPKHEIRSAAMRAFPVDGGSLPLLERMVRDAHPRVQLEAVRALGKVSSARAAELALAVAEQAMDPFLDYALWLTINELADPWVAAVKSGAWRVDGREKQLEFALKAIDARRANELLGQLLAGRTIARDGSGPWIDLIGTAGGPAELRLLLNQVLAGGFEPPAAQRAVTSLSEAARLRKVLPEGELVSIQPLLTHSAEAVRTAAITLAGTWKLTAFVPALVDAAGQAASTATERTAALNALREIGGAEAASRLKSLVATASATEVRREAAVALARVDLDGSLTEIVGVLKTLADDPEAPAFWRSLLGVRGAGDKLATALSGADLPVAVARAGLRPAREGNVSQPLLRELMSLAGVSLPTEPLSAAELQEIARVALATGDAARGEKLYRQTDLACVSCHAIGGAGGRLGPDMTSIGASAPPDYLVESILYPNAKTKEGYHSVLLATNDGQQLTGMVTREDDNEIVLRTVTDDVISVPKRNVATRTAFGSLMPAGLIDTLLPEERNDLIAFLAQLGKPGEYDASQGGVARFWRVYTVTSGNEPIGVNRVVAGDFSLTDWVPSYTQVNGQLPREDIVAAVLSTLPPPNPGIPSNSRQPPSTSRGLYTAVVYDAPRDGQVTFALEGDARAAWMNGTPLVVGASFRASVRTGRNTLVLQLPDISVATGLRLRATEGSFANQE